MDYPFLQFKLSEGHMIRGFSQSVDASELVWHMDEQDRVIEVIDGNSWYLQMDNSLPVLLEQGKMYQIPKMTYHRVIKGDNDLIIEIFEGKKWSKEREDNIDGNNPKGFSERAHCDGKKKNEAKDPKVGTGKKPKGSGRRLYTDENPKDTVSVKFSSVSAIQKTLAKSSFKSKSHKRQSQIINLIHQRVRAAYNNAKDPKVKARLKKAYNYAKKRKEASKKKTIRLRKEKKK